MRVLITHARFLLGGSETYAVTVAEQLERLGHPVELFAGEASEKGRELAASRGLRLTAGDPTTLLDRDDFDAVIAQDAASAYVLASRGEVPQVFVIHGLAAFEHPPQAPRPASPVVAMNDRIGKRAALLASKPEVVRLRQPIDLQRFKPRGPSRPQARRVLVFSNYLEDDRMAMLQQACDDLGLELTTMGVQANASVTPQDAIAQADIVVGYGRSVLEGMVMGKAAYVWDRAGGDGWVTPETYPEIEADGFSGGATDAIIDGERLRADFAAYRPELGTLGYDIVRDKHSAARHTEDLVALLERAEALVADPAHETLGILVRGQARAADEANQFEFQLRVRAEEVEHLRRRIAELAPLEPALAAAEAELAAASTHLENERARRQELEAQLASTLGSLSWRLTAPLRMLTRLLRALRSR
jgi:Glycosyltransferase Family 4